MNKVQLIGRLTRDPETKYSQSSEPIAITRFSVAVARRFKREGEPEADFINCVCFGKTAEFVQKYFNKGKMIGIVGNIRTGSWTDQSGQKRYSTEVFVEEVEFCGSKDTESNTNSNENTNTKSDDYYDIEQTIDDDNLPF